MKPFPSRSHAPLLAAIRRLIAPAAATRGEAAADRETPTIVVESLRVEDWASLTFEGEKHWLDLRIDGSRAVIAGAQARLAAALDDADFELPGHLVADIALVSTALVGDARHASCRLRFEALTIAD